MNHLLTHLTLRPPRCTQLIECQLLWAKTTARNKSCVLGWKLCFEQAFGRILGHELRWHLCRASPATPGEPDGLQDDQFSLLAPLYIEWNETRTTTLIFDSDEHGYHGELGVSAKRRGQGYRDAFACPTCAGELFEVHMVLTYDGASRDLWDDDDAIDIENYFRHIRVEGHCISCKRAATALSMHL